MGPQVRDVEQVAGPGRQTPRPGPMVSGPDRSGLRTSAGESAEQLAVRARDGCPTSFAALVERFAGRLYGYLSHRVGGHDAEDLVQETFLRVLTNLSRYRPERRFSTWLFTIATRLAIDHHRARRRQVGLKGIDRADDRADDPQESAWRRERDGSLWSLASKQLSEAQFSALWLHYVEDLPVAEVAAAMGRTRIGARVLLHRARRKLADAMRGRGADPGWPRMKSPEHRTPPATESDQSAESKDLRLRVGAD